MMSMLVMNYDMFVEYVFEVLFCVVNCVVLIMLNWLVVFNVLLYVMIGELIVLFECCCYDD